MSTLPLDSIVKYYIKPLIWEINLKVSLSISLIHLFIRFVRAHCYPAYQFDQCLNVFGQCGWIRVHRKAAFKYTDNCFGVVSAEKFSPLCNLTKLISVTHSASKDTNIAWLGKKTSPHATTEEKNFDAFTLICFWNSWKTIETSSQQVSYLQQFLL